MNPRPMPPELMARFRLNDRTLNFRALHKSPFSALLGFWVVECDDWAAYHERRRASGEVDGYRTLAEIDPAWKDKTWVREWMYWVHDYEDTSP